LPSLAFIQKGMKFARPWLSLPMGVPMSKRKQQGFTLIEIAIVLVIIGLLLGGILQGQSLINSARVRNLISQVDGVKAAFYGFQDRYRALPGDFTQATTQIAGATTNGNGNGQIEPSPTSPESIAVWDHLSHAGFINGTYSSNGVTADTATTTPTNPWNAYLQLAYDKVYADSSASGPTDRHNLKTGNQIPVEVITEVDRKVDDGIPDRGSIRFSLYNGGAAGPDAAKCMTASTAASPGTWLAGNGWANCGAAFLF
jgi:prepilin-type N-terminal cleavage/methylation domain-containing protein